MRTPSYTTPATFNPNRSLSTSERKRIVEAWYESDLPDDVLAPVEQYLADAGDLSEAGKAYREQTTQAVVVRRLVDGEIDLDTAVRLETERRVRELTSERHNPQNPDLEVINRACQLLSVRASRWITDNIDPLMHLVNEHAVDTLAELDGMAERFEGLENDRDAARSTKQKREAWSAALVLCDRYSRATSVVRAFAHGRLVPSDTTTLPISIDGGPLIGESVVRRSLDLYRRYVAALERAEAEPAA